MAAKKSKSKATKAKPAPSKSVNKSAFIRAHAKLPPQEIVKLAESKGIELSIAMVYTILSEYRKKQGATKTAKVTSKATKAVTTSVAPRTAPASPKSVEAQFVSAILEMGAGRAEELFEATVAKVRALAK